MVATRPRYHIDLSQLQAICEENYLRVIKLMPAMAVQDEQRIVIDVGEGPSQALVMRVLERCRYTTVLQLTHEKGDDWLAPPRMEIRLYHDANMAEVVAAYNRRRFTGVYPYPNEQMLQPDEKTQLNRFLGEWLGHCQRFGQSAQPVVLGR